MTIIFVVSVCLSVCLCRVFLSRLRSDLDQARTHVTCPGLVVSRRIYGLCDPWGLGDPQKTCIFRGFGAVMNHHSVAATLCYCFCPSSPVRYPSPAIDNVWAMVIVWRITRKTSRTVLCCVVYDSCTQPYTHMYEQFVQLTVGVLV